jgi:hypothetical protein
MAHKFIGRILRELGCLEDQDILVVLAEQGRSRERFGRCARRLGLISDDQLAFALGLQSFDGGPVPPLRQIELEDRALACVEPDVARRCEVLPLFTYRDTLIVAVADPFENAYLQQLLPELRAFVGFVVVDRAELQAVIARQYPRCQLCGSR